MRHHGLSSLLQLVDPSLTEVHAARVRAVFRTAEGLVRGGQIWLTSLGRSLPSSATPKNRVKMVDRLLGNEHLHAELPLFYKALAAQLITAGSQPMIAVDWTERGIDKVVLSAALIQESRSILLLSEVHSISKQSNPQVQRDFLEKLRSTLPEACRPHIVADAGFRGPWFQEVERLGWFYVGRLRHNTLCFVDGKWVTGKSLHCQARAKPKSFGLVATRKSDPIEGKLVLFKKKSKGRVNKNRHGTRKRGNTARKSARRAHEPWLLVASKNSNLSARQIVNLYGARFQIEQSFRDHKDPRFGWALNHSQSRSEKRIEVLLLIAAIATIACELIGIRAEQQKLHHRFQANTIRKRRVLSRIRLGRLVFLEPTIQDFTASALRQVLQKIRALSPETLPCI